MKRSLVAGLAWALSDFLWASHYLGGDLTYQCLGPGLGNTTRYRPRFTLYRDCKGIPEPNSVTVNYSSIQCRVNSSVTLFPIGGTGTDITPQIACSGYISSCPMAAMPTMASNAESTRLPFPFQQAVVRIGYFIIQTVVGRQY
jgi:hypothetical protein